MSNLPPLKNTYWLLRHGRSLANEQGIIISTKENGVKQEYTLAPVGREQAKAAGSLLASGLSSQAPQPPTLLVYASPFSRTQETAHIAATEAGHAPGEGTFHSADELCERFFGSELEEKPYGGAYEAIWSADAADPDSRPGGDGESVNQVAARVRGLFQVLEGRHHGAHILLVAHGDTLSILQATMEGRDLRQHRECAFETAELKKLNRDLALQE
mmetsp:Transcript_8479/g.18141  ORF Transcript_8479/g.18141 Transcript_8479/m.18141 type:complete len:215 (+) Transcript_8479:126-770(+)|eukprot:CAMPEP_0202896538 /NCGR_PEP_ID=MMETSP1392-20130828/5531_1 /ASSEMBLY_ACC=CAM_ASM_000868 /TAXON_ID=225041 /ORGANISM="Chlamydomonas chlamydogama, Strain SAG 11-48b" /LENGTH=214 /DNA_ID=CAMNT_0049581937 /DNA_START=106 /DNA_END=750 /DNA_ORIENTATION=+